MSADLDLGRYAICECGHLLPSLRIGPLMCGLTGKEQGPDEILFEVEMTCPKCGRPHVRKWGAFKGSPIIEHGKEKVQA